MSTYSQLLYHIVFATKNRTPSLVKPKRNRLFNFLFSVVKAKNCTLYQINGVEDHIHLVISIPPAQSISSFVKDAKLSSNSFIREAGIFPMFSGWQEGFGVFSYSIDEKSRLIDYVANQEAHHQKLSFRDEYRNLLIENGIQFEERFFV